MVCKLVYDHEKSDKKKPHINHRVISIPGLPFLIFFIAMWNPGYSTLLLKCGQSSAGLGCMVHYMIYPCSDITEEDMASMEVIMPVPCSLMPLICLLQTKGIGCPEWASAAKALTLPITVPEAREGLKVRQW
jgi:hypothetical protein